jgi:uncharacterized protein (TIGR02284 family)
MDKKSEIIEILNDLVEINNDRIEGYKKAIHELKEEDLDLKSLFDKMIAQSMAIKSDLSREIEVFKGDMETGTTTRGKIYRSWMSVKAVFTGHGRQAILENCEYGEDAAQDAYEEALESEVLPDFIIQILEQQQSTLRDSHDKIRELRDVGIKTL